MESRGVPTSRGTTSQPERLRPAPGEAIRQLGTTLLSACILGIGFAAALLTGLVFVFLIEVSDSVIVAVLAGGVAVAAMLFLTSALRRRAGQGDRLFWAQSMWFPLLIAGIALGSFAGVTALLIGDGLATVNPPVKNDLWGNGSAAYEHYLWQVADSVPLLKVPETLHWKPEHRITDGTNSILTLLAKIVVILPFLELARLGLKGFVGRQVAESKDG